MPSRFNFNNIITIITNGKITRVGNQTRNSLLLFKMLLCFIPRRIMREANIFTPMIGHREGRNSTDMLLEISFKYPIYSTAEYPTTAERSTVPDMINEMASLLFDVSLLIKPR